MASSLEGILEIYHDRKDLYAGDGGCVLAASENESEFQGTKSITALLVSSTNLVMKECGLNPPPFEKLCSSVWTLMDNGCIWQLDQNLEVLTPFTGGIHSVVLAPIGTIKDVTNEILIDFALGQFMSLPSDLRLCIFEASSQQP